MSAERPRNIGASLVAAGIFLSRIAGLVREKIFAHYFGNSDAADVFKAALRIPNFLQNLFGEGVLSASFIPVYSRLRAEGKETESREVALAIGMLLLGMVVTLVTIGIFATPLLIDVIAPGFEGEKRDRAIQLVRILFPGTGLLVMSAWCLGILNSHRKFFLSYTAPVFWNVAIIVTLYMFGGMYDLYEFAAIVAWGVVAGSVVQVLVQIPSTMKLLGSSNSEKVSATKGVRNVLKNFGPVVLGRGVVQISAYIDSMLASLLPSGAVSALSYAQTIYLLPVSLFGMAVSAAELPEMSSLLGSKDGLHEKLVTRINNGLLRIAYFVIPSAAAFLAHGDSIAAILFQSGKFTEDDSRFVWGILAGSAVGLLAATMGRLYASAFYAMHQPKTPLYFALIRVAVTLIFGYWAALYLPTLLGIDTKWGVAGLTLSAGIAGWLEFMLLQNKLNQIIGRTGLPLRFFLKYWAIAIVSIGISFLVKSRVASWPPLLAAGSVLASFGASYLLLSRNWNKKLPSLHS